MFQALRVIRSHRLETALAVVILLSGLVYVGNAWSPSCYALALRMFGVTEDGLVWGKPRAIRSDEWAILTPLTQATVNNQFGRFNKTSLYEEDLRINFSFPIRDWGIAFKPTMWGYLVLDPAYAYSLHYFALTVLFILGYAQFFKLLRAPPLIALLLAIGLYYTGFVQFWWNEKAANVALAPWPFIFAATHWRAYIRFPLAGWAFASWLMSSFYPPVQIPLALFFGACLLAAQPNFRLPKPMLGLAMAAAVGAGLAGLYLHDYIALTSTTIYPGLRRVGGGGIPWSEWWSQWLPGITFDLDYESRVGRNICEISTVGIAFTLATIFFTDGAKLRQEINNPEEKWLVRVLLALTLLMTAWLLLPLPSWTGTLLLWDRVQPDRMKFAAGLSLIALSYTLARIGGWRLSWIRLWGFLLVSAAGWYAAKGAQAPPLEMIRDLIFLPLTLVAFHLARAFPAHTLSLFLAASLIQGVVLFAGFNPIQSAYPIFHRESTPVTQKLDTLQRQHGYVAVPGYAGSTLNGWGYRSISHTLSVPKLEFWRKIFPAIPDQAFGEIFNRYANIILTEEGAPRKLQNDAVGVPLAAFDRKPAKPLKLDLSRTFRAGVIEHLELKGNLLRVRGWAPFQGDPNQRYIIVESTPPTQALRELHWQARADVPKLAKTAVHGESGFDITVELAGTVTSGADLAVCVIAEDQTAQKYFVLLNPKGLATCPALRAILSQ